MEPGSSLIVHADIQHCITVCYAWLTTHCASSVALVHVSALANVICQAFHASKKAFCGIGLCLALLRR
eukprot:7257479-Prorocentrum_lima.AAC.1